MSKKLYMGIGLVPLLATAAFLMAPMAAQGATCINPCHPHWYVNGSEVAQGEEVQTLAWGALTLESEPAGKAAPVTCNNVAGGTVENPVGGGSGIGNTENFATYQCVDTECPAGVVANWEKEFNVVSPPQFLPWPSEVTGSNTTNQSTKTFKLNSTGVKVELECDARHMTSGNAACGEHLSCTPQTESTKIQPGICSAATSTPFEPGVNELCWLAAPVKCETIAPTHLQDPQLENGTNQGNGQSKLIFNQPAGSGLSCASGALTGITSQSLKTMGYLGSELVQVKNTEGPGGPLS